MGLALQDLGENSVLQLQARWRSLDYAQVIGEDILVVTKDVD